MTAVLRGLRLFAGAVLVLVGGGLGMALTVDLSSAIRIDGPMNLWPPALWLALVVVAACALACMAGARLLRWRQGARGWLASVVGAAMLGLVARNHWLAPPRDGRNDTGYAAAEVANFVAAYAIAAAVLGLGVWLVGRHRRQRRSHGAGPQA